MVVLYGIKNCDSVKKAKIWLDTHKIVYQFHDFRIQGLDKALLNVFFDRASWEQLINRHSTSWRQLDNTLRSTLDHHSAFDLLLTNPTLIKRPVLMSNENFFIGFDLQQYQTLL